MNHRKPNPAADRLARHAQRMTVAATASLAALTVAASAQATTGSGRIAHDVAAVHDDAHTMANRAHHDDFQATFAVHELGALIGAGAHNRATAVSAGCSLHDPCRSVALSFQIVTMAGELRTLNATNVARAANEHCDGCQTMAGAYQFIISAPRPFTLSSHDRSRLAAIHRDLDDLRNSHADVPGMRAHADALAAQVMTILRAAAAHAPSGPTSDPLGHFRPTVTMHRHIR